jgi:hypothetical protein
VAHGELLQMLKMPPVNVQALLTVGKNCVTFAHQGTCWGVLVLGLLVFYSTLNPSGNPVSRSQMELS